MAAFRTLHSGIASLAVTIDSELVLSSSFMNELEFSCHMSLKISCVRPVTIISEASSVLQTREIIVETL